MKTCPQCKRVYEDATLNFCLEDGEWLITADQQEPATAILYPTEEVGEAPTRAQFHTTDQTAISKRVDDTAVRGRGFDKRLLVFPAVLAIIAIVGLLGFRYLASPTSERINSIAVLPFQNTNSDADYLSDGLTDSLIFRFSQLPDLKVSPTSSIMRYKGSAADVSEIANDLDVDAVLSGRLTQIGNDLSISVQLIEARTKKLIWAEQYDRQMTDLLATQREIAREIVDKLKLKVSGEEKGLAKHYTESNEAYQSYLKGRFYWNKRTEEGMRKALEYYQQAIQTDPKFALAYGGLADAYALLGVADASGGIPPHEAMPKAKAAALRALEIDDTLAEPHVSLAHVKYYFDYDWAAAEREYKRAIELDPNYPTAHQWYAIYLMSAGRFDEAVRESRRAQELDPLSLPINMTLGCPP